MALVRAGRTVSQVARDLGVTTWSLSRWVQIASCGQAQKQSVTPAVGRYVKALFCLTSPAPEQE